MSLFATKRFKYDFQLLVEAHLQRFIKLIQHNQFDSRRIERFSSNMICQSTRRTYDQCGSFAEAALFNFRGMTPVATTDFIRRLHIPENLFDLK